MKTLSIKLAQQQQVIGYSKFIDIKLDDSEKSTIIILSDFSLLTKEIYLGIGSDIEIEVNFGTRQCEKFGTTLLKDPTFNNQELLLNCNFSPRKYKYQQQLVNLLYDWSNNKRQDWRSMKRRSDRILWIRASLCHSGLAKSFLHNQNYKIDGSEIKYEEDLYCSLGECFFGKYGYIGRGLDSLEDCLVEMKAMLPHNSTLTFTDSLHLSQSLNKKYSDSFEQIIDLFRKFKFRVILL